MTQTEGAPTPTGPVPITEPSVIRFLPIDDIQVTPEAQREFRSAFADYLRANLRPESVGILYVNVREGGGYFCMDGQHRLRALQDHYADDDIRRSVECRLTFGLTEAEEAATFLRLNDALTVADLDKFRVGVTAEWREEVTITRIVHDAGLMVARYRGQTGGSEARISAVGRLRKIYREHGGDLLSRTLTISYKAFGNDGLDSTTLAAMSMVLARYQGRLDETRLLHVLARLPRGRTAIRQEAERLRQRIGSGLAVCMAAAIVDTYNNGLRGNARLRSWWQADHDDDDDE